MTVARARRDVLVQAGPHSFGWLRRSDGDEIAPDVAGRATYFECWEAPSGRLVMIPREKHDKPITQVAAIRRGVDPEWTIMFPLFARQL